MNLAALLPMVWILTIWLMAVGTIRLLMHVQWDWTHFWGSFDKFLLVFLVLYFSLLGWHAVYHINAANDNLQKFLDSMLDNQKLTIGALLGLITGRAIQRQMDAAAKPGANNEPEPKV
jgi:amino acid transporter